MSAAEICRTCVAARDVIAAAVRRGEPKVDLATYFSQLGAA